MSAFCPSAALRLSILLAWAGGSDLMAQPTISLVLNQGVYPNATSRPITFVIGDAQMPATALTVSGGSADTNLVPTSGLHFSGTASNRSLTVTPAPNINGSTIIILTVTDTNGLSTSNSFNLDVAFLSPLNTDMPALQNNRMAWSDYDNDGLPDLLFNGYNYPLTWIARIYHNNGDGTFTDIAAPLGGINSGVAWCDFNRDGLQDALVTGGSANLYRNNGGGIFTNVPANLPAIWQGAVAWGDFDNDGLPDLLLAGSTTNNIRTTFLFHNNGDGTFSDVHANLPGFDCGDTYFGQCSAEWGDFDNDGDLDLLVLGVGTNGLPLTKLFRNDGSNVFTEVASGLPALRSGAARWGDYDNDGFLDIALTGTDSTTTNAITRIYHNNRNGTFSDIGAPLTNVLYGLLTWLDFDNDGYLDLLVSGRVGQYGHFAAIYRNNRNGTFSLLTTNFLAIENGVATCADIDGDGDLDVLMAGSICASGCGGLQLYRNNGPTNTPPSAPTNLVATLLPDNNVRLSWARASDAQTPQLGLSYDLRVGTAPGGAQVMNPPADLSAGKRRGPQPSGIHTNSWLLKNVPKGTFYWAVQSIDTAFAGSAFSSEFSFTITNARPTITPIADQATPMNQPTPPIPFSVGDLETPASNLVVSVYAANTNLVHQGGLVLGGNGANRTLTVTPSLHQFGATIITVIVTDSAGLSKATSFTLYVQLFTEISPGPDFQNTNLFVEPVNNGWVDFDHDGLLDFLVSGYYNTNATPPGLLLVARNNGDGTFSPVDTGLTNLAPDAIVSGDYDNDGSIDLLVLRSAGSGSGDALQVLHNDGGDHFSIAPGMFPAGHVNGVLGGGDHQIAWGDYDNDGLLDFVIAGAVDPLSAQPRTIVYHNNGDGTFTDIQAALPTITSPYLAAWQDFDGDGKLDLLLIGYTISNIAQIYRNTSDGKFSQVMADFIPAATTVVPYYFVNYPTFAAIGDFNGDGKPDILFNSSSNIFLNDGHGNFTGVNLGPPPAYLGLAWGDFNNDGLPDLVQAAGRGGTNLLRVYQNNGTNAAMSLVAELGDISNYGGWINHWGDYNKDGTLDILAWGNLGPVIFRNNYDLTNTPPIAPSNLHVALAGPSATLSWTPSSDAQTTNSAALTYNLRVGSTINGINILSPEADPANGFRRLVAPGNVGATNAWSFADLPRGTYYWSVQAVDTAFAGSSFSTNATFTFPKPVISKIPDQTIAPGFPVTIPFQIWDGETAASNLLLAVSWSNTNLVPASGAVFGGGGTNRTITLTPAPGVRGTNVVTITVTDSDGYVEIARFTLIVEPFIAIGNVSVPTSAKIYPADYNNDGLMDFLVTSTSAVQLWRNLGNGTFANDATGLPPNVTVAGTAAWGDYDNDGYLDLAFSDSTNLYHNEGNNQFTAVPTSMRAMGSGVPLTVVAWGDYDNDGKLDLYKSGWGFSQLYRNNGDGTFSNAPVTIQWGQVGSALWGDLDNDGFLDLIATGDFTGGGSFFTYIYHNDGQGHLFLVVSNQIVGVRWSSIALRDFDGDGLPDILLSGDATGGGQTNIIYHNNGNMTFTNTGIVLPGAPGRNGLWGDYNNDGVPDILLGGSGLPATVFVANNNGTFTDILANLPAVGLYSLTWADFLNHGALDVLAGFLFQNTWPIHNQPPQPPSSLAALFMSNSVVLSWSAPTDDHTPSSALTYAVRVGSTPGGIQLRTPDANPTNGWRRLVPEGSLYQGRFRILSGLPEGIYYWSVQAIDSGYAGSTFAPEASFSYYHPTISLISNVVYYPGAPPVAVPITVGDADSPADSLSMSAFASNTNLLGPTAFAFSGSGSNRSLTLTPTPLLVGTSIVTVVVTDVTGLSASNSFVFDSDYLSPLPLYLSGSNYFNGRWADYDGDGRLDLYAGGSIYHNDGGLAFTQVATLFNGDRNGVAWCDFNGDGMLDIAIAGSGNTRIYRNDGNGIFTDIGAALQGVNNAAIAWGDYDNDGKPDLLVTGDAGGGLAFTGLYHNNGDGTFTLAQNTGLPPILWGAVAFGDFDNDGKLDILMNGLSYGGPVNWFTEVYHNNGTGTFAAYGAGLYGVEEGSVSIGDIDNDGQLDLLTDGFNYGNYTLLAYHNDGNYRFTGLNLNLQGTAFGEGQFVDFNNDGLPDIFVAGCTANYCAGSLAALYRNNGDGTYNDIAASLPAIAGSPGSWGDFDNNGSLDLFFNGLYRNNIPTSNSPPTVPTGLTVTLLPNNNVLLSWSPSSDVENTNSASLSYVVRAGTASGATDLVPCNADPLTGYRRLPARGPLNTTSCFLRDLPRGTYYWSVQAIDAGFAGSPFAAETTFTITNARPTITGVANQVTVPGRATPFLNFVVGDYETAASNLQVYANSSTPSLVPVLTTSPSNPSNRAISVVPAPNYSGTNTITLIVNDGAGLSVSTNFTVTVEYFSGVSVGLPGAASFACAWADYDNDGRLDVIATGPNTSFNSSYTTTLYRNTTNGLFSNTGLQLTGLGFAALDWTDFNNDGWLDFGESGLQMYFNSLNAALYRGGGPPVRGPTLALTTNSALNVTNAVFNGAMAWGDYNNDGLPDLLLSGVSSNGLVTRIFRNTKGNFTNSGIVLPGVSNCAVAWVDFDNDGDLDILLTGQTGTNLSSAITKLYRNDGHDTFTEIPANFPGVAQGAFAWGDYDNDGRPDLLLTGLGVSSNRLARLYHNNGDGTFTASPLVLPGVSQSAVAWGDFDNDGWLDFVMAGTTNGQASGAITRIYRNLGGTNFADIGANLAFITNASVLWGDYDNDGDLDLLIGTKLYRNNWNIPPSPPPIPPTNLLASIAPSGDVVLTWSAQPTNSKLTYDLRVGTNSGDYQILAPLGNPADGFRRLPRLGYITTNGWRLSGLTNGAYYWSVQAINSSLSGSAFAGDASFTLLRPVISTIPNTNISPIAALTLRFTVSDPAGPASNIVLAASSSNPSLIANSNLVLGGSDTNRTLTITPTNAAGISRLTISAVGASGQTNATYFYLTVNRFAMIATLSMGVGWPLAWGDYDNDDHLDLLFGQLLEHNNGDWTFTELGAQAFPYSPSPVFAWGDYNQDGYLDVVYSANGATRVYRNNGNGTFTDIGANALFPLSCTAAAWGDFDNDGHLDLVLAGTNFVRVYRNNGNDTFTQVVQLSSIPATSIAWGDYDGDGFLDVLYAGAGSFGLFRNNGNGTFTQVTLPGLTTLHYAAVAWGDFDNDGRLDFAVCGSTNGTQTGGITRVYRNLGGGSFTNIYPAVPGFVGVWKGAVAWGDYDNDGDADLIVSGQTATNSYITKIYRNDGGGLFADSGEILPGLANATLAWGDFDNDGNLDLALSGASTAYPPQMGAVFRNFSPGPTNIPPFAPTFFSQAIVGRKAVRLAWRGVTDSNQSTGLTYNVRIGTTRGSDNLLSPMASSNGWLRLPHFGNAAFRTNITITNLPGGTYWWNVQAVDNSFAGSRFCELAAFTVPNIPPSAANQFYSIAEDNPAYITLAGSDPDGDPLSFQVLTQPLFGLLAGAAPNLVYHPASNYFGFDQFTFLANDHTTNSPTATVFITITPVEDLPGATLGLRPGSVSGQVQLSFLGEPWRSYRLEASQDLIHWVPLTNLLVTNLVAQVMAQDSTIYSQRFYRSETVVIQPQIASISATNGQFQMLISGEPGRNYQVQISSDLQHWSPLQNVLLTNSVTPFADAAASAGNQRFYRVVFLY